MFLRRFCWKGCYGVRVDAAELRIVMGFALAPGPGSCDDDGRRHVGGIFVKFVIYFIEVS